MTFTKEKNRRKGPPLGYSTPHNRPDDSQTKIKKKNKNFEKIKLFLKKN